MMKLGLGKKLLLGGALAAALVLGTVVPANAAYWVGPYKTLAACKAAERTYNSAWTKIYTPCLFVGHSNPSTRGYYFGYRNISDR